MPNVNIVIMAGHLTRDPEVQYIGGEKKALCKFGLAVSKKWKDKEEVCFIDCTAWGRQAELIGERMRKGSAIHITGELKLEQWTGQDGGKRAKHSITVRDFQFLGGGQKPAEQKNAGDDTPF